MKIAAAVLLLLLVAATAFFLMRDDDARADRSRHEPAAAEPEADTTPVPTDTNDLGLEGWIPEVEPFANRGPAFQKQRTPEALERDYQNERRYRVELVDRLVATLGPVLKLDKDQAKLLREAILARGDASRIAFYREHAGAIDTDEFHRLRTESGTTFDKKVAVILRPAQLWEFRRIEEDGALAGQDLGFGVLYGMGEGGGRSKERLGGREKG